MPYCTKADIIKVLPEADLAQLTDDTNGTTVDDDIVTAQITKADNQINTYCRGKNDLPFNTTTTPRVNDWSITLSIWNLYKRRVDLEMPEPVRVDHDDVITELKGVRDGKILVNDPDSHANQATFYKGNGEDKPTLFSTNEDKDGTLDEYYSGPA